MLLVFVMLLVMVVVLVTAVVCLPSRSLTPRVVQGYLDIISQNHCTIGVS